MLEIKNLYVEGKGHAQLLRGVSFSMRAGRVYWIDWAERSRQNHDYQGDHGRSGPHLPHSFRRHSAGWSFASGDASSEAAGSLRDHAGLHPSKSHDGL